MFIGCGVYVRNIEGLFVVLLCVICVSMVCLFDFISFQLLRLNLLLVIIVVMDWLVGVFGLILQILLLKVFLWVFRLVKFLMFRFLVVLVMVSVNFVFLRFCISFLVLFEVFRLLWNFCCVGIQLLRNMLVLLFFSVLYLIGMDRVLMLGLQLSLVRIVLVMLFVVVMLVQLGLDSCMVVQFLGLFVKVGVIVIVVIRVVEIWVIFDMLDFWLMCLL